MDYRKDKIREASEEAIAIVPGGTGTKDSALAMRTCGRQTEGHYTGYGGMRKRQELRMVPSFFG